MRGAGDTTEGCYRGVAEADGSGRKLSDCLAYHADVFAPSEKQILKNYREVPIDILENSESLLLWARKAAQQ